MATMAQLRRLRPAFCARIRSTIGTSTSDPLRGLGMQVARRSASAYAPARSSSLNRDLTRMTFSRFYAKKTKPVKLSKGAKAAKAAKEKKEKGKKEAMAKESKAKKAAQAASAGGGDAAATTFAQPERWSPREPEELVDDALFTGARGLQELTPEDVNKYFYVSENDARKYFAEGFPGGLIREFQASGGSFIRMRKPAVDLLRKLGFTDGVTCEDEPLEEAESEDASAESSERPVKPPVKPAPGPVQTRKHFILDGPVGCGKSFTLATIVQWARLQGWLVFYAPNAKSWTRGGYYYLNELTGYWDTPLQAQSVLQAFLDSHADMLAEVKCRIPDFIYLGEAAGLGRQPGPQKITMPEGSSLKDLVEKGITLQTAASNIVVRLRKELDLVTEFPVLIAVDEYNSWFNFSDYFQFLDFRKRRHVHSKELAMVNAFRKMDGTPTFFIGAFSKSTGVGKLPVELPGAPKKARLNIDRFTKEEVKAALDYYYRQKLMQHEPTEQTIERLFYLTNGNGMEIRKLARIL